MPAADSANLYCLIEAACRAGGARTAIVRRDGSRLTYDELDHEVARMAGALMAAGIGRGDRVMAQIEKSIANVVLYLATVKVGAIFNPLNTQYTLAELDYFIGNAEPALLVAPATRIVETKTLPHKIPARLSLETDGSGTLVELARSSPPVRETASVASDDLAALLYTSGTTGRSKGAMLTHRNLASNALTLKQIWDFTPADVLLHALPIFHVHGLFVALNTVFASGASVLWLDRFEAGEVMRHLPQATVMMGVPTFYTRLLAEPEFSVGSCRTMRLVISGSAPLLAETHRAFTARTGHAILERYGMTETGMITSNPLEGERVAGTVGYALPGVSVRVTDADGHEVARGEPGTVELKGPNVFKGYWRMPERTAEEFRADGYFTTGDVGTMAADGRLTLVGRAKDLIISGGLNVYPAEIEDALNALPGVEESAVVGVPHPDFGEAVIAVVAARQGTPTPEEASLLAAIAGRFARFKQPKRIFILPDLPRNAMGKVRKAELRERYGGMFSSRRNHDKDDKLV